MTPETTRRVLVTGATGFVGRVLCEMLASKGYLVRAAVRLKTAPARGISETVQVGDITGQTDWSEALAGVDLIIHAAARTHVLNDSPANASLYHEINAAGTRALADSAASAGVRRFVFLSSIKVNGEQTRGAPFSHTDAPAPEDSYGRSKLAGERNLSEICSRTGMEGVIVRPPLVYGPGVRANFLRLMRWVDKERPLPLAGVSNRRSLVSVWNLCDFIALALVHPRMPGTAWCVSDGEDLSTPDLIRRLAAVMQRKARLFPVPVPLLVLMGALLGKRAELARLCGSLVIETSALRDVLGWLPPVSVSEGLRRTVDWYLAQKDRSAG